MNDIEAAYWLALEYRISRELEGFADPRLRYSGCDGLRPETYDLRGDPASIHGDAFMLGNLSGEWRFTLLIGAGANTVEEIGWPSLLPAEDVTGWLSPHPRQQKIVIEPLVAYPDSPESL